MNQQVIINKQLITFSQFGGLNANTTLIFLHGWRSQKEVWNPVIQNLLIINNQLSIIAIDLPGFGASPVPDNDWDLSGYANIAAEFIKKLDLKNVCVVGHSFGGRVGIKLASSRADLVKKLVLVDSAGFVMDQNKKAAMSLAAKLVKPLFKPKFMQGLRKKIYRTIGAEDYVATPHLQKIFVKTIEEDLSENMKRILQPTLIVFGEKDLETPIEYGNRMSVLIPKSRLQILKDAGHFSFLDKTGDFVSCLVKFL